MKTCSLAALLMIAAVNPAGAVITINPFQYSFAESPGQTYFAASVIVEGQFAPGEVVQVDSPGSQFTGYANGPYYWGYFPFSDFDLFKAELEGSEWTVTRTLGGLETVDTFTLSAPLLSAELFGVIEFSEPAPGSVLSASNPGTVSWSVPAPSELGDPHANIYGPNGVIWDVSITENQAAIPLGLDPGTHTFQVIYTDYDGANFEFSKPEANGIPLSNGILFSEASINFTIVPEPGAIAAWTAVVLAGWGVIRRTRRSGRP